MITIGFDPGKSGAIAFVKDQKVLACIPFPFVGDELDVGLVVEMIKSFVGDKKAVLEKVHAMPGQGVCSMFTFGKGYGELRGMLKAIGVPFIEPTPQQWKKKVLAGCDWKGNKMASCEHVMKRYPDICLTPGKKKIPHDGMADAICLAEYGQGE